MRLADQSFSPFVFGCWFRSSVAVVSVDHHRKNLEWMTETLEVHVMQHLLKHVWIPDIVSILRCTGNYFVQTSKLTGWSKVHDTRKYLVPCGDPSKSNSLIVPIFFYRHSWQLTKSSACEGFFWGPLVKAEPMIIYWKTSKTFEPLTAESLKQLLYFCIMFFSKRICNL